MAKPNELEQAGLELMRRHGKPLTKREKPGRGGPKVYDLPDGQTVRVRTCDRRALITRSATPDADGPLDIEGTDWLLVVIPVGKRASGKVEAYLVPSGEAAEAVQGEHERWLKSDPRRTKGQNRTPVLRFNEEVTRKWERYRLPGESAPTGGTAGALQDEIAAARRRIAALAGVPHDAVQVTIQFAT
jgi:hypothetical protein